MTRSILQQAILVLSAIFRKHEPIIGTNVKACWNLFMQRLGSGANFKLLNDWRSTPENRQLEQQVTELLWQTVLNDPEFANRLQPVLLQLLAAGEGSKEVRLTRSGKPAIEKGFRGKPITSPDPFTISTKERGISGKFLGNTRQIRGIAPKKKAAKKMAGSSPGPSKPVGTTAKKPSTAKKPTKAVSPENVTCFFRATMPNQVILKKETPVELTISREKLAQITGELDVVKKGKVQKDIPLSIQISGVVNIKIKGNSKAQIPVPDAGKPASVSFLIVPTNPGLCKLRIDVFQGQVPVSSFELAPNCVKKINSKAKVEAVVQATTPVQYEKKIIQLRISEREMGKSIYYDYQLDAEALGIFQEYQSPVIKVKREKYVSNLYKEIEDLWNTAGGDPEQLQQELRNYGAELFTKLFPLTLQQDLWSNRDKIKSIQVVSTEPFIPWELILVKDPDVRKSWTNSDKFLGEMGLTRWLFGSTLPTHLSINKAKYVIPQYENEQDQLPAAILEEQYLTANFAAKKVNPDPVDIRSLMQKPGSFDLLHFCCHGGADPSDITHSRLLLQGKKAGVENKLAFLTQLSIEHAGKFASNTVRPIIVLNACQVGRSGNTLVGYGGFANAFLKGGAGAFIGSHWSIEDESAVAFITAFYDALRAGKTLAEATTKARQVSAKKKDATWISYIVYGNPFARLQ